MQTVDPDLDPRLENTRRKPLRNRSANEVYKQLFHMWQTLCEVINPLPEIQERNRALQQIRTELQNGGISGEHLEEVTPLLRAVEKRNYTAIRLLLEHGVDPTSKGSHGWTPLLLAEKSGDPSIVKLLQLHGGSPNSITRILVKNGKCHQNDISEGMSRY
ncbi:hypothetical protein BDV27DRAFT_131622 [Aspergillus caelatus]|uniref:Uncharacterized protein n=1 Tax=Aspergillus caelatus TaxID=61420 RepID=A0A5N6ZXQ0_9EURO|nr:uncharacterized protein BDV27DRAFT_131622 [Aspergillus caelatus]KAE8362357.1 hypothetical protein BDV27DRAFT_131622 [Aspergillus caelatus]